MRPYSPPWNHAWKRLQILEGNKQRQRQGTAQRQRHEVSSHHSQVQIVISSELFAFSTLLSTLRVTGHITQPPSSTYQSPTSSISLIGSSPLSIVVQDFTTTVVEDFREFPGCYVVKDLTAPWYSLAASW